MSGVNDHPKGVASICDQRPQIEAETVCRPSLKFLPRAKHVVSSKTMTRQSIRKGYQQQRMCQTQALMTTEGNKSHHLPISLEISIYGVDGMVGGKPALCRYGTEPRGQKGNTRIRLIFMNGQYLLIHATRPMAPVSGRSELVRALWI